MFLSKMLEGKDLCYCNVLRPNDCEHIALLSPFLSVNYSIFCKSVQDTVLIVVGLRTFKCQEYDHLVTLTFTI